MKMRVRLGLPVSVFMIVAAVLLASCSTTVLPPGSSDMSTAGSRPYGSLIVELGYSPRSLDPIVQGSPNSYQSLGAAIFDALVEISPEGQLRPGIAERWEISPDGKTLTFYVRRGVKVHNGDDLTGADVKFSLERIMTPESTHSSAPELRNAIASVELKDAYTVALNLKQPRFELLPSFTNLSGTAAVLPKKYIEEKGIDYFRDHPIGSGPWKVVSMLPGGQRYELEAVESHWREVPKFKNITVLSVPEESTKLAMLKTGELDMSIISPDSAPDLKASGLRMISHDGAGQGYEVLFYNLDNPEQYALGDVRVRKAVSLAINRREMADALFGGYGEPSALHYARPTGYFWDPNVLKPDPYDPEQAKKLLVEAGYPNGFSTRVWAGEIGKRIVHQQAVMGYLRKIGVNADLVAMDSAPLRSLRYPVVKPEMFNTIFGGITEGGVWQFEQMGWYHSTRTTMRVIRNPKLDELIDKVPATRDPAEKKRLALEAAVMAKNDYSTLSTIETRQVIAIGPKVGGITLTAGMGLYAYGLASATHAK